MSLGSSGNATIRRPQDGCNGAESTVSGSSLSILLAVLGAVWGGSVFRLMGQNVSCSALRPVASEPRWSAMRS
jgi:hypothetical protein